MDQPQDEQQQAQQGNVVEEPVPPQVSSDNVVAQTGAYPVNVAVNSTTVSAQPVSPVQNTTPVPESMPPTSTPEAVVANQVMSEQSLEQPAITPSEDVSVGVTSLSSQEAFVTSPVMNSQPLSTETAPDMTGAGVEPPNLQDVAIELQDLTSEVQNDSGLGTAVLGHDPMEQVLSQEAIQSASLATPALAPVEQAAQDQTVPGSTSMPETTSMQSTPTENEPMTAGNVLMPTPAEAPQPLNVITGSPEAAPQQTSESEIALEPPADSVSNKGLLIAIVIIVTILFGGAAVVAFLFQNRTNSSNQESSQSSESADDSESQVSNAPAQQTPSNLTFASFGGVCANTPVADASAYEGTGPHPLLVFDKIGTQFQAQDIAFTDAKWAPLINDPSSTRLVACVQAKLASEKKLKSCPVPGLNGTAATSVDLYSVSYTVDVYEAQTARKVAGIELPSETTDCPSQPIFDVSNPKIYAQYSKASFESALSDVVTKNATTGPPSATVPITSGTAQTTTTGTNASTSR